MGFAVISSCYIRYRILSPFFGLGRGVEQRSIRSDLFRNGTLESPQASLFVSSVSVSVSFLDCQFGSTTGPQ